MTRRHEAATSLRPASSTTSGCPAPASIRHRTRPLTNKAYAARRTVLPAVPQNSLFRIRYGHGPRDRQSVHIAATRAAVTGQSTTLCDQRQTRMCRHVATTSIRDQVPGAGG
jgi:hypothetical protein